MPETARGLAKQLGIPFRMDLLRGTSREAKAYQDTLTQAAVQEAWKFGGGDTRRAAQYYFAGPDKSGWGPKTRKYGEDILRRLGQ